MGLILEKLLAKFEKYQLLKSNYFTGKLDLAIKISNNFNDKK